MTHSPWTITRRDLIRTGSLAAAAGALGLPLPGAPPAAPSSRSRVVLARDPAVIDSAGKIVVERLETMLDQAVCNLFGVHDIRKVPDAWRQVAGPKDVVGIKSNVWQFLPTPAALEEALRRRFQAAGVAPADIAVDDRGVLKNSVFQRATVLVNVRTARTHHWSGLGTCLKNYIMFVPDPWTYHPNACENLGALWKLPLVQGKTRLNILVMLTPLFHGIGPHHFSATYVWPYAGLVVGRDPVSVDSVGARIIQAKRLDYFKEDRPISPPPLHIAAADTKFGLGPSSMDRIDLVRIGPEEGALI
jgi:hypothetical protein